MEVDRERTEVRVLQDVAGVGLSNLTSHFYVWQRTLASMIRLCILRRVFLVVEPSDLEYVRLTSPGGEVGYNQGRRIRMSKSSPPSLRERQLCRIAWGKLLNF